ncbi:MAG: hypothetical protein R6X06_05070 [Gammaproteobacteria bacterium]
MKRTLSHALIITASLVLAAPAYSAGYIKLDGVDGESKPKNQSAPARGIKGNETPKPATLLLPAVQKAREGKADNASKAKKKGNVEYNWKVEEGTK